MANEYAPLTTIFTPPPECQTAYTFPGHDDEGLNFAIRDYDARVENSATMTCSPSGLWRKTYSDLVSRSVSEYWGFGTWSPGICPSGQTTAALTINDNLSTVRCCEIGFTISTQTTSIFQANTYDLSGECVKILSGPENYTVPWIVETVFFPDPPITYSTSTIVMGSGATWAAAPLAFLLRSEDLSRLPVTTTSVSLSSSMTTSQDTTAAATGSSTPSATVDQKSGLSTAARAGIGIGVALGVLSIIALAIFIFFRRRKHRKSQEGVTIASSMTQPRTGELDTTGQQYPPQLDSSQKWELYGRQRPSEMPITSRTAELEGGR